MQMASTMRPILCEQAITVNKDIDIQSMKNESKTQRLMSIANHKLVEKTSRGKAFTGINLHSDSLIDCLQAEHPW